MVRSGMPYRRVMVARAAMHGGKGFMRGVCTNVHHAGVSGGR